MEKNESFERTAITKDAVIAKLREDGDFHNLRARVVEKLHGNEELRKSISSLVKQSAAFISVGAEKMECKEVLDAIYNEVGFIRAAFQGHKMFIKAIALLLSRDSPSMTLFSLCSSRCCFVTGSFIWFRTEAMKKVSDGAWAIIRSVDMKTEILGTIRSVCKKLEKSKKDEDSRPSSVPSLDVVENDNLPDSEPNEPPGFSLSNDHHSQNTEHHEVFMGNEKRPALLVDGHHQGGNLNLNLELQPGFLANCNQKPQHDGGDHDNDDDDDDDAGDEDPDVPPGFG